MVMAENKYKPLVRTGEWKRPSREQKEILALNAKLEKLNNKNKADSEETKIKRNMRFEWNKGSTKRWGQHREEKLQAIPQMCQTRNVDTFNQGREELQLQVALTAVKDN